VALHVAGLAVFPAALAGTAVYLGLDWVARWVDRNGIQLDRDIASELASWLNPQEAT
jgi:hypothetical protein